MNIKKGIIGCIFLSISFLMMNMGQAQNKKTTEDPKKIAVFILAGQSNMEGHAQTSQLKKLLCAVDEFTIENNSCYKGQSLFNRVFETITDFYRVSGNPVPQYDYNKAMAENEARELVSGYQEGSFRAPLLQPLDGVKIIDVIFERTSEGALTGPSLRSGKIEPGYGHSYPGNYGPELLLGHKLKKYLGQEIVFVKLTQGGSDLYEKWRSTTMSSRLPPTKQESLYPKLVLWTKNVVGNLANYFPEYKGQPLLVEIKGFLWLQGWNDSFNSTFATAYEQNLTDFMTDFRNDLALPNMPIVIGQSHNSSAGGLKVQAAQKKVAETLPKSGLIITNDLSRYFHFDSGSHPVIGTRFANKMNELLSVQKPGCGEKANVILTPQQITTKIGKEEKLDVYIQDTNSTAQGCKDIKYTIKASHGSQLTSRLDERVITLLPGENKHIAFYVKANALVNDLAYQIEVNQYRCNTNLASYKLGGTITAAP